MQHKLKNGTFVTLALSYIALFHLTQASANKTLPNRHKDQSAKEVQTPRVSDEAVKFSAEMADLNIKASQKLQQIPAIGNVDRDFANFILAQNQGAIEMAELELKYGKDPEMLQMARRIIDGQKADNKVIKDWSQKHQAIVSH